MSVYLRCAPDPQPAQLPVEAYMSVLRALRVLIVCLLLCAVALVIPLPPPSAPSPRHPALGEPRLSLSRLRGGRRG